MKRAIPSLIILILLVSCKKTDSRPKDGDAADIKIESNLDREEPKVSDCDNFMDKYEEWMEEYLVFLEGYKDDPTGAMSSPEYMKMVQAMSTWSQDWISLSVSCASNPSYQKRFEEISRKTDAKIKELGFR